VLFTAFGPVEQSAGTATEFPGIRFRLETAAHGAHASSAEQSERSRTYPDNPDKRNRCGLPGKKGPDFRIIPDPERAKEDVRFVAAENKARL
jgi:hypothetical protein